MPATFTLSLDASQSANLGLAITVQVLNNDGTIATTATPMVESTARPGYYTLTDSLAGLAAGNYPLSLVTAAGKQVGTDGGRLFRYDGANEITKTPATIASGDDVDGASLLAIANAAPTVEPITAEPATFQEVRDAMELTASGANPHVGGSVPTKGDVSAVGSTVAGIAADYARRSDTLKAIDADGNAIASHEDAASILSALTESGSGGDVTIEEEDAISIS